MSAGICSVCGIRGLIDLHHPAGRRHVPDWLVPLCKSCHRDAHQLLAMAGVPLGRDLSRVDVGRVRAVAFCQLLALHYVHQGREQAANLFLIAAAVASIWLDSRAAPDRPGRFLPDPRLAMSPSPRLKAAARALPDSSTSAASPCRARTVHGPREGAQ